MKLTRESMAHDFTFVVDGADSVLAADRVLLDHGTNSTLRVENGGLSTNNLVTFGAYGHRIVVDGAGSRLRAGTVQLRNLVKGCANCGVIVTNGGFAAANFEVGSLEATSNYVLVAGTGSVCDFGGNRFTLGSSVWSKHCRVEVVDGGTVSNLTKTLYIGDCGYNEECYSHGHVFAFRGANTRQTLAFTDKPMLGRNYARENRFEVTDGAQVTLGSSTAGNNRFWVGTAAAAVSNVILVAGQGSSITGNTNAAWLIGQHSRGNRLEIRDGGIVKTTKEITIGQGDSATSDADENVLLMENGGRLECSGFRLGYGDGSKAGHANGNRIELLSGSTLANTGTSSAQIWVGYNTNSCGNVLHVSDSTLTSGMMLCVGRHGSRNRLTVENGGEVNVTAGSVRAGENYNGVTTVSNAIEVLSGGLLYSKSGMYLQGVGASLSVSNGTVRLDGDAVLPYAKTGCYSDCPCISVAGTNSLVYAAGTIEISSNAVLRLAVPRGGWLQPAFQTASGKSLTIRDLGAAELDLSAFLSGRTVLARAGGALSVDAASLKLMNDALPENSSIKVVGSELVLARNTGTQIFIR